MFLLTNLFGWQNQTYSICKSTPLGLNEDQQARLAYG